MVWYILIGVSLAIVGLLLVVAMKSPDFRVNRQAVVDAPPEVVFPLVNDFHQWKQWSPWEGKDPNMQRNFSGASAGSGAVYGWVGNKEVGEGRMTITESHSPSLIKILLEFIKPWSGICNTEFSFTPKSGGTLVSWTMTGKHSFVPRLFCLFMNMDKMIGDDFEKGLAKMKSTAEQTVGV